MRRKKGMRERKGEDNEEKGKGKEKRGRREIKSGIKKVGGGVSDKVVEKRTSINKKKRQQKQTRYKYVQSHH
jgi:hypothetical protein